MTNDLKVYARAYVYLAQLYADQRRHYSCQNTTTSIRTYTVKQTLRHALRMCNLLVKFAHIEPSRKWINRSHRPFVVVHHVAVLVSLTAIPVDHQPLHCNLRLRRR